MSGTELWCEGRRIASEVREARSFGARAVGLLGRSSWPRGVALKIAPCRSIHTWFMRFSIDVIFADESGRIVRVIRNLKPWRMAGAARPACAVYEWSAGSLPPDGLRPGSRLEEEPEKTTGN